MEKIVLSLQKLSAYDALLNTWAGSLISLVIRLYVGWQFFKAGMIKLSDWNATLALFRDEYHVPLFPPEMAAAMGMMGELTLPVLLFVGLLSRPAALGLFMVNVIAVISYPMLFKFDCPAAINDHFYWGMLLLVIIGYGSGKISLDHWFSSQFKK